MQKILYLLLFYINCFNLYLGCNCHDKVIFCNFFLRLTNDESNFDISDIDSTLCTHLIPSYASLEEITLKVNGTDLQKYLALKEHNNDLKIILGIGGWKDGSTKYSKMAADPKLRKTFVENVLNILENQKIDGVDIAWDTPTLRGGIPEDKVNHATLLKHFETNNVFLKMIIKLENDPVSTHNILEIETIITTQVITFEQCRSMGEELRAGCFKQPVIELSEALKPKGYLLIATLRANNDDLNSIFDLVNINNHVDFVNVLSSEYYMAIKGVVGPNAPLRNVESSINTLLSNGLTRNKTVLSLPSRGHTFILNNPETKDVILGETTTKMEGFPGQYINQTDYISYFEICYELKDDSWIFNWDELSSTPYLRNKEKIIAFDNARSIANKVKLAMDYDLAGVSIYTLPTEDYKGVCPEDTDTYKDYIFRYNLISHKQSFKEALAKFFLEGSNNEYYVISENRVNLRIPTTKFSNYPLLNTINEVIPLALEEKKVVAEMEKIEANEGQKIPCQP